MTTFTTTTSSTSTGTTGTVEVTVSDKPAGGGDETNYFDVLLSVEDSSYVFTGGTTTPKPIQFGANNVLWSKIPVTGSKAIEFEFSSSTAPGSNYVASVIKYEDGKDPELGVVWGKISPGTFVLSSHTSVSGVHLHLGAIDWLSLKKLLSER